MERNRSRSPVNDEAIDELLDEFLDDNFISDIPDESDNNDENSENESSTSVVDDTDSDPDYDPNTDLRGHKRRFLSLNIGRLNYNLTSSSDEDDPPPRPLDSACPAPESASTSTARPSPAASRPSSVPRPRGRPRNDVGLNVESEEDVSEDEDGTGWTEVTEGADEGVTHNFDFHEIPGVKHCPPRNSPAIAYFKLFFTVNLITTFVENTNKYAKKFIEKNRDRLRPHSRSNKWKDVTLLEMQAFIAVLLNMGLNKKPTIFSYWNTASSQFTPWFTRMFNRNRFQAILQFFHMVDTSLLSKPTEPNYDPCARFSPLIDHFNRVSKFHFTPNKNVSIDESMVSTKSHSQLLQYMPKKRHRWGVKLWSLCDAVSHYCLTFFVYRGAKGADKREIKKKGLGFYVVEKLLQMTNMFHKGFHVFVDNYFTSLKLAKYLYSKFTFLTGTLKKSRKGVPQEMKNKFDVGMTKYLRKNKMTIVGYRQKKSQKTQVLLLTTDGKAESEQRSRGRGASVHVTNKPKIIRNYNDFMGGVDGGDQMLYEYLDDRRTIRFWKKVTFNIFSRMMLNCYLLYKLNSDKPVTRYQFTINIVDDLSKDWLLQQSGRPSIADITNITPTRRSRGGPSGDSPDQFFEKIPDRREKNCCVCSAQSTKAGGKRKKSSYMCRNCKKGIHTKCFPLHHC